MVIQDKIVLILQLHLSLMAIFCLATDLKDLENRIGNITIGYTRDKKSIYAKDLNAQGPMTVLLKRSN